MPKQCGPQMVHVCENCMWLRSMPPMTLFCGHPDMIAKQVFIQFDMRTPVNCPFLHEE